MQERKIWDGNMEKINGKYVEKYMGNVTGKNMENILFLVLVLTDKNVIV